eukprot:TRINITY_DN1441_c0_g1_i1.p1 TRINITY_DN1441_c0_g1~~TRINITY_DN1441_c0_g1_i1.p1  ORF type:complete len:180 (-),score=40.22 TRINITY_DN1441_c0_g1_i1:1-540(-)
MHPILQEAVVGFNNGEILVFDVTSGQRNRNFPSHEGAISQILFRKKGEWVVSCSWDATARIFNYFLGSILYCVNQQLHIWGAGLVQVEKSPFLFVQCGRSTITKIDINGGTESQVTSPQMISAFCCWSPADEILTLRALALKKLANYLKTETPLPELFEQRYLQKIPHHLHQEIQTFQY